MQCDMCGDREASFKGLVEGVEMSLCNKCAKYGSNVKKLYQEEKPVVVKKVVKQPEKEVLEIIVSDYSVKVKRARERLGLKQEELAKRIAEKTSTIHNIESGRYEPSIELARKLERFLGIKLVEEYEEAARPAPKAASETTTIGDVVRIRKR